MPQAGPAWFTESAACLVLCAIVWPNIILGIYAAVKWSIDEALWGLVSISCHTMLTDYTVCDTDTDTAVTENLSQVEESDITASKDNNRTQTPCIDFCTRHWVQCEDQRRGILSLEITFWQIAQVEM